jgi:hypothetical protein
MIVMGLVITSYVLRAAAQRSRVEDVAANYKPSDDDTEPLNDLELSRSMDRRREMVHEADRAKLTELQPKQNHMQYLEQPCIRLMVAREEKERAEKARRSKGILWQLFVEHSQHRDVDRTPKPVDHHHSKERSRDRSRSPLVLRFPTGSAPIDTGRDVRAGLKAKK